MQFDHAITCEAAAAIIAMVVVIIKIVHGLCKLLSILYLIDRLLVLSFLFRNLVSQRRLRWIHLIVNVVRFISYQVEELTTEVLETLLTEVTLTLHDKGSYQVSQLVLSPFFNVFLLVEHFNGLSLHSIDQRRNKLSAIVQIFELLYENFGFILQIDKISLEITKNFPEELDRLES